MAIPISCKKLPPDPTHRPGHAAAASLPDAALRRPRRRVKCRQHDPPPPRHHRCIGVHRSPSPRRLQGALPYRRHGATLPGSLRGSRPPQHLLVPGGHRRAGAPRRGVPAHRRGWASRCGDSPGGSLRLHRRGPSRVLAHQRQRPAPRARPVQDPAPAPLHLRLLGGGLRLPTPGAGPHRGGPPPPHRGGHRLRRPHGAEAGGSTG